MKLRGSRAAAPKGSMTYAFTHMWDFLLLLLLLLPLLRTPPPPSHEAHISASRPIFLPRGPNPSLEAQIPTSRPKSLPQGPNSSLKRFGPQGCYLGLEDGIWASRLRYGPRGWGEGGMKKEEKEKEEKIPRMCESMGHRPLWSHCPAPQLNAQPT